MSKNTDQPGPHDDLSAHWKAEQCPIIDGIIFGDGRVRTMSAEWRDGKNGRLELVVEPHGETTLTELASAGKLQWTGVIALCNAADSAKNLCVLGGEGGLGSDGFVAVLDNEQTIKWIAFCNNSNPFDVVQISDDCILAKSTLGTWWRFPLQAPEQITLT